MKKIWWTRGLALMLAMIMTTTTMPLTAFAAQDEESAQAGAAVSEEVSGEVAVPEEGGAEVESPTTSALTGSCGDDLTWTLVNGVLTVSGTGAMWDNSTLWPSDDVTKVVIQDGMTAIGSFGFGQCYNLTEVTIPDSVETVGYEAFYYCTSLETVNMGTGVTSIGAEAFYNCESLTEITIPEGVTAIADYTFQDCSALTEITIPASVESIGDLAFGNCTSLSKIHFKGDAPDIAENAFLYTSATCYYPADNDTWAAIMNAEDSGYGGNLLWLEEGTDGISGICGAEGDNLTWTLTGTGVLTISGTGEMADYSGGSSPWRNYEELITKVVLTNGVTSIGDYAFYSLAMTEVVIPNGVTSIGSSAFGWCENLINVDMPDTVTEIGNDVFYYCTDLTSVDLSENLPKIAWEMFYYCSSLTEVVIPDSVENISRNAFRHCTSLESVSIGSGVTSIDGYAFYNCSSLTEITIPDGVTEIGDWAFSYCYDLEAVTFGTGLTELGDSVFYDCIGLTEIEIPATITVLGESIFTACSSLANVTIQNGVTKISYDMFGGCESLTTIDIPASVTSIDKYAFNNSGLTAIEIPNSVTEIGAYAFNCCRDLSTVTLPNTLTVLADFVFNECEALTGIEIPASVETIGGNAFSYAGLTKIAIPNNVTEILPYAFSECSSLAKVTIGSGVTVIGESAFYGCSDLTEITVPNSVSQIGYRAFEDCSKLTTVTLGNKVEIIAEYAFYDCLNLTEITLPASVTTISDEAFFGCTDLTEITFLGSAPEISEDAFSEVTATCYYPAGDASWTSENMVDYGGSLNWFAASAEGEDEVISNIGKDGLFWTISERTLTISGEGDMIFHDWTEYADRIMSVVIKDGVTSICAEAFYNCDKITDVTIGNGVVTIGDSAFDNCDKLKTVTFGNSVTDIGQFAFSSCPELIGIDLPDSCKTIGNWAFYECFSLVSAELGSGLESIGMSAFNKNGLTYIAIPESVVSMDASAFAFCEDLSRIKFRGNAPALGANLFTWVEADVYYPAENDTWTDYIGQEFGGTLYWEETSDNIPVDLQNVYAKNFTGASMKYQLNDTTVTGEALIDWSGFDVSVPSAIVMLHWLCNADDLEDIEVWCDGKLAVDWYSEEETGSIVIFIPEEYAYEQEYCLKAYDWSGNLSQTTVTRVDDDTEAPTAGNLTGTIGTEGAVVSWTNHADDVCSAFLFIDSDADGMYDVTTEETLFFDCDISKDGVWTAEFSANTCEIYELVPGSVLSLLVTDGAWNMSVYSCTLENDGSLVETPRKLTATADLEAGCINLSWQTEDQNISFVVERSTDDEYRGFETLVTLGAGTYTYTDTDVVQDQAYYYRIIAINAKGYESEQSEVVRCLFGEAEEPKRITDISAESTEDAIQISWQYTAPADFSHFNIYRSTDEAGPFEYIDSIWDYEYCDDGLSVEAGTTYYYYVTACDGDGYESEPSPMASAAIYKDETAPEISDVWPFDGVTICHDTSLQITASDNYRLDSATITISSDLLDEDIVFTQTLDDVANWESFSFDWDLSDLPGGEYSAVFEVTDTAGNSDEATASFSVYEYQKPVQPEATVEAGYKSALLSWTYDGDLDLLSRFLIYTCDENGENLSYVTYVWDFACEVTIPKGSEQYFLVVAEDMYAGTAQSEVLSVTSLETESEPPVAVIMPADLTGMADVEVTFSGVSSTDNDVIVSYEWDFGDGSTGTGETCTHTYNTTGIYTVKLTVTDESGNTDTATKYINIYDITGDDATHAMMTVTVRNAYEDGLPVIAGATVKVFTEDGAFETTAVTGDDGTVTLVVPLGEVAVGATASGFAPHSKTVTVTADGAGAFVCETGLTPLNVSIMDGSLTVREMTREEIIEAGIDINAPENQHVWEFEAVLEFVVSPDIIAEHPVTGYVNSSGGILSGGSGWGWGGVGGGGGGGTAILPDILPDIGVFPVAENIYLVIYGQTHWLKEMFNVELLVANNSYMYDITDCTAKLTLPEGMSLAAMIEGAQSETIEIGTVGKKDPSNPAASTKKVNWYLCGDDVGEYYLTASVDGLADGEPFSTTFKTDEPVKVLAGQALHMYITADKFAAKGLMYSVEFELKNVSTKDLYNVGMDILGAEFQSGYDIDEIEYKGGDESWQWEDGACLYTDTLKPGESLYGEFQIRFTQDLAEADVRYMLNQAIVRTLESSTTEVPVTISLRDNTFYYPSMHLKGDVMTSFFYDEDFFTQSARIFNPELAYLTMCLAASAYNSTYAPDAGYAAEVAGKNVKDLLMKIGFAEDAIELTRDGISYGGKPQTNSIAAAIASKPMVVDGEEYTLIAVAVRGGGYEREWHDNFWIGSGTDHKGFSMASTGVVSAIDNYIEERGITGNVKFWITGFSRGAAVANLTAARLVDGYLPEQVTLGRHDMYAYCFATPANTKSADIDAEKYYSIYSIINPVDAVPMVAPADWGFSRYGTTLYLPSAGLSASYDTYHELLRSAYAYVSNHSYGLDGFQMKKLGFDVDVDFNKGLLSDEGLEVNVILDDNNSGYMQEAFLQEYLGIFFNDGIENQQDYLTYYENAVCDLIGTICGDEDEREELLDGLVDCLDWGKYLAVFAVSGTELAFEAIKVDVAAYLSSFESDNIDLDRAEVKYLLEQLKDVLVTCVLYHPNYTVTMACNLDYVGQAHYAEVYLAWTRLMQSENNFDESAWTHILDSERAYRKIAANCPVDLNVYEIGAAGRTLVAQIIDKKVQKIQDSTIIAFVDENDQMVVYLPYDGEYEVEIIATGDGELSYSITETNMTTGENSKTNYYGIAITEGDELTGKVNDLSDSQAAYTLIGQNNAAIEPDEKLSDAEIVYHAVSVTSEGPGYVLGGGNIAHGSFIKLIATEEEDCVFLGWFVDGEKVSEESEYRFSVQADVDITAKFCRHAGGTATCTAAAICENCGLSYGELDPSNHSGNLKWTQTDKTHSQAHDCCGAVEVAEEAHEWSAGVCSECEYVCTHIGGTATCTTKAVCTVCGQSYGEKDSSNHTGTADWTKTATHHSKAYICCGAAVVPNEVHEWNNGICSECGYTCTHTGGTATCTAKATCTVCGQSYGEKNTSNHTGTANWTRTATHHSKAYTCCGAVVVANEVHEWNSNTCSECEYVSGAVNISEMPVAANAIYLTDLALSGITLSGGKVTDAGGATALGAWAWAEPNTKLYAGTASYKAVFTPDNDDLDPISADVMVRVSAADQIVTSEHATPEKICTFYAGPGLEMKDMTSSNLDVQPAFVITEDEGNAYVEGTVLYSPDAGYVTVEAQYPGVDVNGDGINEYNTGSVEIHTLFTTVPMHRMYDPNSGEHFYTGSMDEVNNLVAAGWEYEGVAFNFPALGPAVYRLYDGRLPAEGGSGDHLYTMDQEEIDRLVAAGWNNEGAAFNSAGEDGVPQYRLYNPNAHLNGTRGAWHFTSDEGERNVLLAAGWQDQGIGWYSTQK